MGLSDKLGIKTSSTVPPPFNNALYAKEPIKAGEEVSSWPPELVTYTRAQILGAPPEEVELLKTFSYMIDDDTFCTTPDWKSDPSYLFNHSCDPNCWFDSDHRLIARRDIAAGEEMNYDYATTEVEASFHAGMVCKCGAATCRGVLSCTEWRSPAFQRQYKGHVTTLVQRKMHEVGWYDHRLYLKRIAEDSRGLFTLSPIRKGEVVLMFGGKTVPTSTFLQLEDHLKPYTLQIARDFWQVPHSDCGETADYINHSCDPTCLIHGTVMVFARHDLPAGIQITLDYATVDPHMYDCFDCDCGASDCRRRVTGNDCRQPELIRKYWPSFAQVVKDVLYEDPATRQHIPAEINPDAPQPLG